MRKFKELFKARKLANKVLKCACRKSLAIADEERINNALFFIMATCDTNNRPQCSYKGDPRGFVQVIGSNELPFPSFEGTGLYLSAGNIAENFKINI